MSRNAEGMFDDLSGVAPAEPAPVETTAPAEPVSAEPSAEPKQRSDKPATEKTDPANSPARPDGYVPKQALEEARSETKREREARERAEANFQRFLDRWQAEQDKATASAEADEEPDLGPDPEVDPVGAVKWMRDQKAREFAEAKQRQQAEQSGTQVQRIVAEQASRFSQVKAQHPVLDQAYKHLIESVAGENALYGLSGIDLTNRVHQWEAQVAQWAHQKGLPIEDVIWNLAQRRGFRPPEGQPQPAAGDDGGRAEPAKDQQRDAQGRFVSPEAERAAKIAESQERNGSLSQAPGVPVEKMTAKELGKMSEDEMWRTFDSMTRRKGGKEFDRAMGFRP